MRRHVDAGALSILLTTYGMAVASSAIIHMLSALRLIGLTLVALVNVLSLSRVHLRLISRLRPIDYLLLLINIAPYTYVLIKAPLMLMPSIALFTLFTYEALRGRGRGPLANVTGTVLMASVYGPWLILLNIPITPNTLYVWFLWMSYHAFSSTYVEGRLPFRDVKPWASTVVWLTLATPVAYMAYSLGPLHLVPLIEPTVRAIHAIAEGKIKPSEVRVKLRRVGFGSLAESLVLASLAILTAFMG